MTQVQGSGLGLSQEEVAALREAVAPEAVASHRASLGGGDRRARQKLSALAKPLNDFSERVRRSMAQKLRVNCTVKLLDLELAAHLGMQHEAQTWLLGGTLTQLAGEPLAHLGVSPQLGFHLIELAYGGGSTPARALPPRLRLTRVEEETLFVSLAALLDGLLDALWPGQRQATRKEPLATPPQLDESAAGEVGVVTALELALNDQVVRIGIIISPMGIDCLEPASVQAAAHASGPMAASTTYPRASRVSGPTSGQLAVPPAAASEVPAAALMRAHLSATEVEVGVDLGVGLLQMGELAALRPGEVVWLERGRRDPLVVCVAGTPKFLGMPIQRHGALCLQIVKALG